MIGWLRERERDIMELIGLSSKVYNPYLVTFLIITRIFEWDVVWCGSKNMYQKIVSFKEIGLRAQNMITF